MQPAAPQANALLETDLIHTFVAISESGSFTAAARRVLRTPSAVSMQMKRLEEQLGRPLFVRHPRAVTLTPDGEAFLVHCREILRLNDEALSRFRIPQLEGRVRFGAPDDFGTRILPRILARFATTHPLVDVDVVLSSSADLTDRLAAGDLDLTLVTAAKGAAIAGTFVSAEPLVWIGAPGGRACRRDPLPLALADRGCPWRAMALDALDRQGLRYRIAYTSETGQGQLAAVEADLAVAPLPISLVTEGFERLGARDGLGPIGDYELRVCEAATIGSAGKAFAAHVIASFGEAPR